MVKTDDSLITAELIEATYLFCYKRLMNAHDSEDLAQDILCEAIKALRSGRTIVCFYSWYWAMAKNRLRMFLRLKQNGAVLLDPAALVFEPECAPEAELLAKDEISELNYAVSRISSLHRNIIILFYLKKMKISEIAGLLEIPEGTVKRRLFDAKKEIRKGFGTMDHYGKTAYAPAEVELWGGYSMPDYWNNVSDLMTKQIFAVCAKEAKTVREIADEIGVAPVYFEEKLQYLLKHQFLKESTNGKYLTDFCIYPKQLYCDFLNEIAAMYSDIGRELTDVILSCEADIRRLNFYGCDFTRGRLLWILYCEAADMLSRSMLEIYGGKWKNKIPEQNGKSYRIAGTVLYPEESFTEAPGPRRSVAWSNLHHHFKTSGYAHIDYANLFQAEPFENRDWIINESNADLFMRIFDDPKITMTANEEEAAANLIQFGYLTHKNDGLFPTMPVMTFACQHKIQELLRKAAEPLAFKYAEAIADIGEKKLLPHTRRDLIEEFVHWIMQQAFFPVGYLYFYGSESGLLEMPGDPAHSSLGICIYYKE